MDLKCFIKSVFLFWKPGVGRRLSIYFTITGIIIGYISILIFLTIATKDFIQAAGNILHKQFLNLDESGNGDLIWRSINTKKQEFAIVAGVLKSLSSKHLSIGSIQLFYYNTRENRWYVIFVDDSGLIRQSHVAENQKAILEKTRCRHSIYHNPFFWGQKETSSVMMDVTGPNDKNRYLLQVSVNRGGITALVGDNRYPFLVLTFFILLFSHLLGHFFAWRIARPIEILSEGAVAISRGKYDHRFRVTGSDEFGRLASSLNSMAEQTENHIADITGKMNALETMNKIDKATLSAISRDELLDRVIGIVSSLLPEYSISLALRNDDKKGIEVISHYDARKKDMCDEQHFISWDELELNNEDQYCELFQISRIDPEKPMPLIVRQVLGTDTGSVINYPIYISGEFLGSFVVSRIEPAGFSDSEVRIIGMLADQTGVALQSVRLTEDREQLLMGILRALTRAIDAKSRWTAGHSERVSVFSERIGTHMGLSIEDMRTLSMSAILHDIGKIGVPEQVLDKPGKLTDEEFAMVSLHSRKGVDIIGDVPYYESIKMGILYHHERWDGSGYPEGLAGEKIPESARIIAVADVYDALTYDRPYRTGWPESEAVGYLLENRGSLFDPRVVNAFIASMETASAGLPEKEPALS